ncbi:MAG TPA: hypothetical protein VFI52_04635 [Gemmatimonadaceae bacterium]|nr:hypothetical protein [Gemmatimonadaceae bacterium]
MQPAFITESSECRQPPEFADERIWSRPVGDENDYWHAGMASDILEN